MFATSPAWFWSVFSGGGGAPESGPSGTEELSQTHYTGYRKPYCERCLTPDQLSSSSLVQVLHLSPVFSLDLSPSPPCLLSLFIAL